MCYSGKCKYEYLKADQDCGCSKPVGALCPHEQEALDELTYKDFETDDGETDTEE